MFEVILNILFISFGSVIGANLRMELINRYETFFQKGFSITLIINIVATFLMGFLIASQSQALDEIRNNNHILFFNIGILGSFSTFSAFLFEVFQEIKCGRYIDAFLIASTSLFAGVFTAFIGYKIAYAI